MNDLISNLAEQCYINRRYITQTSIIDSPVFNCEKFAELVIKECVHICRKEHWAQLNEHPHSSSEFERGVRSGKKIAASECARQINAYFGIKE